MEEGLEEEGKGKEVKVLFGHGHRGRLAKLYKQILHCGSHGRLLKKQNRGSTSEKKELKNHSWSSASCYEEEKELIVSEVICRCRGLHQVFMHADIFIFTASYPHICILSPPFVSVSPSISCLLLSKPFNNTQAPPSLPATAADSYRIQSQPR